MARWGSKRKLLVIFGTRPEAIKLMPVITALRARSRLIVRSCSTGQHHELLASALSVWQHVPDIDLRMSKRCRPPDILTGRMMMMLGRIIAQEQPDRVIVQGDTSSALAGALAAHFRHIPVGHVEAGLRSGNLWHPWPEEGNRRLISQIADMHFAPTASAARALSKLGIPAAHVHLTGNTGIDALLEIHGQVRNCRRTQAALDTVLAGTVGKRLILLTTHRRESLGKPLKRIAAALEQLARRDDVAIVAPLHPNPDVQAELLPLAERGILRLLAPLDYPDFVALLDRVHIVLTDSGGIQEEAPALGKPVLVLRDTTERPEGIKAGTARLTGTDTARIVAEVSRLLDSPSALARMSRAHSPYGDGRASQRIADLLERETAGSRLIAVSRERADRDGA